MPTTPYSVQELQMLSLALALPDVARNAPAPLADPPSAQWHRAPAKPARNTSRTSARRQRRAENRLRAALRRAQARAASLEGRNDALQQALQNAQDELRWTNVPSIRDALLGRRQLPLDVDEFSVLLQEHIDKVKQLEKRNAKLHRDLEAVRLAKDVTRSQVDELRGEIDKLRRAAVEVAVPAPPHDDKRLDHALRERDDASRARTEMLGKLAEAERALLDAESALERACADYEAKLADLCAQLRDERRARHATIASLRTLPSVDVPALLNLLWPGVVWLADAYDEIADFERLDDFLVTMTGLIGAPVSPASYKSLKAHRGVREYRFNHGGQHGGLGRIYFHPVQRTAYAHNKRNDAHQERVLGKLRF